MQSLETSTVETEAQATVVPATESATVETSTPAKPKRERKPKQAKPAEAPEAAKPVTPAADSKRAERIAIVGECLALAQQHYNGASPSFHRSARPCKRADYAARVLSPVQTAKSASERDESHLATIVSRAKRGDASFDPAALACDLGVISRLASLGHIAYSEADDAFTLTDTGAKLGRNVLKRLTA